MSNVTLVKFTIHYECTISCILLLPKQSMQSYTELQAYIQISMTRQEPHEVAQVSINSLAKIHISYFIETYLLPYVLLLPIICYMLYRYGYRYGYSIVPIIICIGGGGKYICSVYGSCRLQVEYWYSTLVFSIV